MVEARRSSGCSHDTIDNSGDRPRILHGYEVPYVFEKNELDVLESFGEKAGEWLPMGIGMLRDDEGDRSLDRADEIPRVMVRAFGVVVGLDLGSTFQFESFV